MKKLNTLALVSAIITLVAAFINVVLGTLNSLDILPNSTFVTAVMYAFGMIIPILLIVYSLCFISLSGAAARFKLPFWLLAAGFIICIFSNISSFVVYGVISQKYFIFGSPWYTVCRWILNLLGITELVLAVAGFMWLAVSFKKSIQGASSLVCACFEFVLIFKFILSILMSTFGYELVGYDSDIMQSFWKIFSYAGVFIIFFYDMAIAFFFFSFARLKAQD